MLGHKQKKIEDFLFHKYPRGMPLYLIKNGKKTEFKLDI